MSKENSKFEKDDYIIDFNTKQFIVGKWYTGFSDTTNIYGKLTSSIIHIDKFPSTEYICGHYKKYNDKGNFFYIRKGGLKKIKEVSLEEIQQYLPEGHPDKIIKNSNIISPENWQVGDIIECINNGDITKNGFTNNAYNELSLGAHYVINSLPKSYDGSILITLKDVKLQPNKTGFKNERFKFHSRPNNKLNKIETEKDWKESPMRIQIKYLEYPGYNNASEESIEEPIIFKSNNRKPKLITINN